MLKTILALCAVAVVFPQSTKERPDLPGQLAQLTRSAFEGSDARALDVVVLLGGQPFASVALGPDQPSGQVASLDAGLHAIYACMAMQLSEKGELDLQSPVGALLPELGATVGKLTPHELLTHTSGLHDWTEFNAETPAERLSKLGEAGTVAEPGTCFQLSGGDTFVLGMLLQRLHKGPIIDPGVLDLFRSAGTSSVVICKDSAAKAGVASALGEAELCGRAADLAAFMGALADRSLTTDRSWISMTVGDLLPDGSRTRYGHGLDLARLGPHERVAFGGEGGGARLQVAFYPAFEMTIAVLATEGGRGKWLDVQDLERSLARAVYAVPDPEILNLPVDAAEAARYTGDYLIGCDQAQVRFSDEQLSLLLPGRAALHLLKQADNEFVAAEDHDIVVKFEIDDGRAIAFMLNERGWPVRATRIG